MAKEIKLTKGKVAIVDDEDFERVNALKWTASNESRGLKWYAIRSQMIDGRRMKIRMHRFILGLQPGLIDTRVVNHINDNSLDNRKCNLEILTQEENMLKSPGWKRKVVEPCL